MLFIASLAWLKSGVWPYLERTKAALAAVEQRLQERPPCMVRSDLQHPAPREAQLIVRPKAVGADALLARSGGQ
jgi:hypothetical protein